MTLLELLFNLPLPTLLLPNNEGQPGTFPMPAFGEYLADWSFYLRTHMPYVDDLYQPTIRKYLVVEAAFIYFYLIAALRRFRIAQYYLLIKLTTFALLFLTSGFSYLNILAWILCFVVYPLELIVMYWFGHLLAWYRDLYLRTIYGFDPVTDVEGGYIGKEHYDSEEEYDAAIKKRDHDVAEMKRRGGKWRLGLRGDLHTYFVLFIFSYAYAKFKMILGNPLAALYKLDLFDDLATLEEENNSGLVYEEDGDFVYISSFTRVHAAGRYERVTRKHPLISVLKEKADYSDILDSKFAYKEEALSAVVRLPESRAKLFNYPYSYLFGKELPWLTQEEAALASNAERWLSEPIDAPAHSWTPILDPFKEKISAGATPARSFYHWNKDMVTAKGARAFFRKLRGSWYRFAESAEYAKESPNFGDRTLAQRIIDTCSTNQFAAERAAVLTPTNKRYTTLNSTAHTDATLGYFAPARWRYTISRLGAHSAFNEALVPGNENMAWHDYYTHTFGTDAGWSRANRSHPYFRPFCVEPFWHEQTPYLTIWSPRTSPMRPHTHVELQVGKPARPGAKPLERAKWEHPIHARPAWELSQEDHSLLNQRSYEALLRKETAPTPVEYPTVKPVVWDKKRKGPSWLESYIQKKLHPRPTNDRSRRPETPINIRDPYSRSESPIFNTHDLSPTPPPPGSSFWRNRTGSASTTNRFGFSTFNFEQFAPLMELDSISNLRYGLLFILALSSLTVYSIILAGWSSNSKYAFLGALRSAAQMISYEVSISLALLPVILLAGSLNLTAIVCGQIGTVWYLFPLLPIALIFLVSMLAETNRTPFDLPEAEAELVAGYNVDYSSLPFAMFFLGEYSNMILISVLFCLLFLGGWDGALLTLQEPYMLTFKAAFVWVFFVIVRATLPRYRYDQLMDIGWKAFLPFAGSFLVLTFGLVVFLDVAPVVEEVALEDLYGVPALPPTAAACLVGVHSHHPTSSTTPSLLHVSPAYAAYPTYAAYANR